MTHDEVVAIKNRHSAGLLKHPGVTGVGVQRDEAGGTYYIQLLLETDDPVLKRQLPIELEGVPVRTIRSGPLRAL